MHDGQITCTGPSSILFKASLKIFNSPGARVPYGFRSLPDPYELPTPEPVKRSLQWQAHHAWDGSQKSAVPYEIVKGDAVVASGTTGGDGRTARHQDVSELDTYDNWLGQSGWAASIESSEYGLPSPSDPDVQDLEPEHGSAR